MASEQPLAEARPQPSPPSPPRAAVPEPAVVKLTRGHSCVLCQQRKVRCDKQKPCANCVKAQVECRVIPPQPPRRRKKKPHERDLIERLRKYESLLAQHGVKFDPIAQDLRPSDHADDVADLEQDLSGLKTSPSCSADHVSPDQGNDKQRWASAIREYRGERGDADDDSSDEEQEGRTIHSAYDTMYGSSDGFPFVVGGSVVSVTSSHPSAIQIFQLWQFYISNVNPLLKITHTPTLQAQIISASANPSKIPRPLEALMFAIYFASITSLSEDEVHSTFGEDKAILLGKYHNATQQALINAGFMRSSDLMLLQAFFLYLLSARQYVDPRSMYCLLGIAFRIATRLNLHRDGSQLGLSPFEAEQRRRLWWQIVVFDKRIAEITGTTVTALSSCPCDTRLPLNINDADLDVHAKGQPNPYPGPTEMIFCLTRIELAVAGSPDSLRRTTTAPGGRPLHQPMVHFETSPASPDVVSHVANQYLPENLAQFCAFVENVYLQQCDPKIPLHYFTLLMTRQALCKLRIIDFLRKTADKDHIDQGQRDSYFMEALRMVEIDNIIQSSDMLQGFRWYTYAHFPLPAYLCLVHDLRQRTTGELCERAWNAMIENHERRGLLRRLNRNPLHIAFGHFLVKAWDAREAAELQRGRSPPTPKVVSLLRETLAKTRRPTSAPNRRPNPVAGGTPGGSQQVPAQPTMPPRSTDPPGMTFTDEMHAVPGGVASAGVYHSKPMPHPTAVATTTTSAMTAPPMAGMGAGHPMMIDDSMMYPGYGNAAPMYGSPVPVQDPELSDGGMDWDYLVQLTSLGGFNPTGNYYYVPQGTEN